MKVSAGAILSRTFAVWFRNLHVFIVAGLAAFLPLILYTVFVMRDPTVAGMRWFALVSLVGGYLTSNITTGLMAYGVFQALRGTPVSMGAALTAGFRRLVPILATTFAVALLMALCLTPMFLLMRLAPETGWFLLAMLIGLVILVYLAVLQSIAVPVAAVEGAGPLTAIRRAFSLSIKARDRIFGVLIILLILNTLAEALVDSFSLTGISALLGLLGVQLLSNTLDGTAKAVIYHDVRVVYDGVSTEELSAVFE